MCIRDRLITSAIFGAEKYGEAYGIANSFTQIGLSLGALMVAAIYDTSGSYNTAWILLLIPVSYTHLDVYKRQLPHAAQNIRHSWKVVSRKLHYKRRRIPCKHFCFL